MLKINRLFKVSVRLQNRENVQILADEFGAVCYDFGPTRCMW